MFMRARRVGWLQGAGQDYNGATRMILTSGTKLGAYEIQSVRGAGGTGNVYRALDTKLRRDVALKILPETFARDFCRLMRFERDPAARLASSGAEARALGYPRQARRHAVSERMLGCYATYISAATLGLEAASGSRANRA